MDDFIRWLNGWVREEYDALQVALSDRTGRDLHATLTFLARHYTDRSLIEIDRPEAPDEAWFVRSAELMRFVEPRRVFKVAAYASRDGGTIWRAYLGSHNASASDAAYYARSYFVSGASSAFQIFSIYAPDSDARELGDGLEGWYWVHGARVAELGQPIEVRRLLAPGKPRDRREFDRGQSATATRI